MALVRTKITSAPQSMLVNNMSMSTYRQIARQRQISAEFRHSAIISLASERLFSTLLNTLNCIKPKNFGQVLCRATAKIRLTSSDMSPSTMESVRCALSNRIICRYGV